jgi:hypothetical protein
MSIIPSWIILSEGSVWTRIGGPFFIMGVFFILFLYAPIASAFQLALRKFGVKNPVINSVVPATLFAAEAGWVIGSWSNPLPSIGIIWTTFVAGVFLVLIVNILMFRRAGASDAEEVRTRLSGIGG